jgi:hypothetical protein
MNVREMAAAFGVSERTARRHIAHGTPPDPQRTVGCDGYAGSRDSYRRGPRSGRPYSALSRDLGMARNAVRRLTRATAFSPDDLTELRTIRHRGNRPVVGMDDRGRCTARAQLLTEPSPWRRAGLPSDLRLGPDHAVLPRVVSLPPREAWRELPTPAIGRSTWHSRNPGINADQR